MADDHRRRPWFRYRLGSLLIVVLLLCVTLGWVTRVRQQKQVIARLSRVAPIVRWSVSGYVTGLKVFPVHIDPVPQMTDEEAAWLRQLPKLRSLEIVSNRLTDDGLAHVGTLSRLKILRLHGGAFTDDGLRHLKDLTQLNQLEIGASANGKVTDDGISHLGQMQALRYLDLSNIDVTDDSLNVIREFSDLQQLHLAQTQVTRAGVDKLRQSLPNCQIFYSPLSK